MQQGQLLGSQSESLDRPRGIAVSLRIGPLRRRRHRGPQIVIPPGHSQGLLGNRNMQESWVLNRISDLLSASNGPSSKLEELKARTFTLTGREERIARSLAALTRPSAIQLSEQDWEWLDENADLEDDLE